MTGISLDQIDPLSLPSLPLTLKYNLPNIKAIYFVLEGDEVVYIGRTNKLSLRWQSHHILNLLQDEVSAKITWLELAQESNANSLEILLIRKYQPNLNKKIKPPIIQKGVLPPPQETLFIIANSIAALNWTSRQGEFLRKQRGDVPLAEIAKRSGLDIELIKNLEECAFITAVAPATVIAICKTLDLGIGKLYDCTILRTHNRTENKY